MKHRLLIQAAVVAAMGAASVTTPRTAEATFYPCYDCWTGDTCPDGNTWAIICAGISGGLCPYPNECLEATQECPLPGTMRITCQSQP